MFLKRKKKSEKSSTKLEAPTAGVSSVFRIKPEQRIVQLPDFNQREKIDVKYPLIEHYVYVRIYWDTLYPSKF